MDSVVGNAEIIITPVTSYVAGEKNKKRIRLYATPATE